MIDTIPPEALEAAAIELHRSIWGHDCYSWADVDEERRNHFRKHARAALAAALNAWEGANKEARKVLNFGNNIDGPVVSESWQHILILPMSKEPRT